MTICRVCKCEFSKSKPMQSVCSPSCALSLATSKREKSLKVAKVKDKRDTRAKLDAMKTRGQYIAEAQASFNAFIRARDAGLIDEVGGRLEAKNALATILEKETKDIVFCEYESSLLPF